MIKVIKLLDLIQELEEVRDPIEVPGESPAPPEPIPEMVAHRRSERVPRAPERYGFLLEDYQVDWAVEMRIRPPEFETSICDAKYHVSLVWRTFETSVSGTTAGPGECLVKGCHFVPSIAHVESENLRQYTDGLRPDIRHDVNMVDVAMYMVAMNRAYRPERGQKDMRDDYQRNR
ncbi:hypothetical protein F511_38244 [Dorcoceras hygrometricum]|uniref:Uncharacterized protein n=1 Tax=Dorcoceras hygrometricum TaxID=472368 RepID=A0A2Z7C106_9LAMI|nr:hypothetical protein F511_38244 [Dorcoceras hygrometricum]